MRRIPLAATCLLVLLGSGHSARAAHLDARVDYLRNVRAKGETEFTGSIRFSQAPTAADFARMEALGVRFFDFGHGPAGSRTVFPATIPFSALDGLAKDAGLAAIDTAWRPQSTPPLAQSRPQVQAHEVWPIAAGGDDTTTGDGVVVCDIDTGVNYHHANFFRLSGESYDWIDADGSLGLSAGDAVDLDDDGQVDPGEALLYLEASSTALYGNVAGQYDPGFDYLYNDANANGSRDEGPPDFGENDPCYGERFFLCEDTDQDGQLDPGERLLALGDSRIRAIWNTDGSVHRRGVDLLDSEADAWGHGTQVTNIMGGGWAGLHQMTGMAPGIETLHVNYEFADEPFFLLPIEAGTAWAVSEGADIVLVEDGEWVWTYFDGSSNYEIMIDEYTADQDVIFVVPGGNLSAGHMHARYESTRTQTLEVAAGYTIVWPSFLWTDPVSLSLTLIDPAGGVHAMPLDGSTLVTATYRLYSNVSVSPRGTRRIDLRLASEPEGGEVVGTWRFMLSGPATTIDAYYGDDFFGWSSANQWLIGEDAFTTVTWPATADSALVVAAYRPTGDAEIHAYSGRGPRIDGTPIVDIAAPGNTVYSADPWTSTGFRGFGGTSSAGPHVAGAVALLKELFPSMTPAECERWLRDGAQQDEYTTDPREAGGGKLRIRDTVALLLTAVADAPPARALAVEASPNPFNPAVSLRFDLPLAADAVVRVFDLRGREVWSRRLSAVEAGTRTVRWDGRDADGREMPSGTYFAHVKQGDTVGACKMTLLK